MTERKVYRTKQVAVELGITYGALRTRMNRGSISPPFDMIELEGGGFTRQTRRALKSHDLIWYYKDVQQAKKDLKLSRMNA